MRKLYKDSNNVEWLKYQNMLMPFVPPDKEILFLEKEMNEMLKMAKAYIIRWNYDWDLDYKTDFWYIIKDDFVDIKDYSSNTRSKIRRGLKRNEVKRVDKDYICQNAYNVYKNAFSKYNTYLSPLNSDQFKDYINSLKEDIWEFWAVYDLSSGNLIAYSQNLVWNNSCEYQIIKFDPSYLRNYVSYALFYTMNKYYLLEKNFKFVSDGARSISHDTNIQDFLVDKFKFRKAFCKLNVKYRGDINIVIKILYPLRKLLSSINTGVFNKIGVVLKQEEISRSFK